MDNDFEYLMKLLNQIKVDAPENKDNVDQSDNNVKSTQEINKKVNQSNDDEKKDQSKSIDFLYRGHAKESYLLQPLVFRVKEKSEYKIYSYIMTKHYELFKGMKPLEVLSKMQHLGVATRLLDITKNPLVGIFFAVDSLKPLERTIISDATINNYSSSSENGVKEPNLDTEKKSSDENAENKPEKAELIVFKCPNREIKNYDSDTVKLLSCLPLLKEENQKKLLADAINEYLIQFFVEHALSKFIYCDDDGRQQLHTFDRLNNNKSLVLKEIVEKITTHIKKIYYLDEKYGSTSHIGIVLRDMGIKGFNKIKDFSEKKEYNILIKSGKPFYNLTVELHNNNEDKRIFDISRIKITIMIELLPLFGLEFPPIKLSFSFTKGESNDLYPIVVFDANDSYYMFKDQDYIPLNDITYDILSQLFSEVLMSINDGSGIYRSKSMEELYQKVKSFYPEFKRCAKPLDLINGVFVYPIVNTDRMRAQKGLFALYGLSQYWNFQKYMKYQESKNVGFYPAIRQFIENNVNAHKWEIRDMEEKIYGIDRISIEINKAPELNSALKELGVDKETLGCSLETTYYSFIGK